MIVIFFMLSLLFEYLFHRLWVEGLHGGQFQTLHHMQCSRLVFLEVVGLQMTLICLFGCIDFEDTNLRGVLSALHGEQADDTRLTLHTEAVHLVGICQVFL